MNSWPRLSVMLVTVVLTAAVVVALKGMFAGSSATTPALMTGASRTPTVAQPPPVRRQPTILQAKPAIPDDRAAGLGESSYQPWNPEDADYSTRTPRTYGGNPTRNPRLLDHPTPPLDESPWRSSAAPRQPTADSNEAAPPQLPLPDNPATVAQPPPVRPQPILQAKPAIRDNLAPVPGESSYQPWTPGHAQDSTDTARTSAGAPNQNPRLLHPATAAGHVAAESVYVTRRDDSLWSISTELYGSGGYYIALYLHNRARIPFPDRLPAGVALKTPAPAQLRLFYPDHCPAD